MSARSTGIQAGKEGNRDGEKPKLKKRFEELCFPDALILTSNK